MKMHKWSDVKKLSKLSAATLAEIEQEVTAEVLEMNLKKLRESVGLTQTQVAEKLKAAQPQLSALESRTDHRVSTLRRYVHALGGELRVQAVVNGKTIDLMV